MGAEIRSGREVGQEQNMDNLKCQLREVNVYSLISVCFAYFGHI